MNIGNIFNQVNNAINNMNMTDSARAVDQSELALSLQRGVDILSSMSVGSSITGTVVGFNQGNLLLQLSEGSMVEARLEGMQNPEPGAQLSFTVKGNSSGNITLTPLYANLNPNSTVSAALNAAGLSDNPQMQYMVRSMMEEGLGIDRDSLLEMSRLVSEHPLSDPKDIAVMQRLNIPINDEMLTQFENYKNYEHTIGNALTDVSDAFVESSVTILEDASPKEALEFIKNTLDILLPDRESTPSDADENIEFSNDVDAGTDTVFDETKENIAVKQDAAGNITANSNAVIRGNTDPVEKQIISEDAPSQNVTSQKNAASPLNTLDDLLKNLQDNDALKADDKILKDVKDILKDENFGKTLKNEVSKQWMLKPEDVGKQGSVSELYDRLNSQIKTLTENLSAQNRPNTPIAQAAGNISGNINFMNELNQTFNYVQIPLKFEDANKTGELYVYTNKKSMASNDGTVSALLHLDMDNLGPVDVHVVLNEANNVKTKFMLKDDSSLDLIAQNIEILNARLNKRGYNMNAEFVNKDEQKSVFENMIEDGKNVPILSNNSFDARA